MNSKISEFLIFSQELENIACTFFKLLNASKQFDIDLSSVDIICSIAKFICKDESLYALMTKKPLEIPQNKRKAKEVTPIKTRSSKRHKPGWEAKDSKTLNTKIKLTDERNNVASLKTHGSFKVKKIKITEMGNLDYQNTNTSFQKSLSSYQNSVVYINNDDEDNLEPNQNETSCNLIFAAKEAVDLKSAIHHSSDLVKKETTEAFGLSTQNSPGSFPMLQLPDPTSGTWLTAQDASNNPESKKDLSDVNASIKDGDGVESEAARFPLHLDSIIYTCCQCNQSFPNRHFLKLHMFIHTHCEFNPLKDKKGYYCCPVCGLRFDSQQCCATHLNSLFKNKKYTCILCLKVFVRNSEARHHIQTHNIKESCAQKNPYIIKHTLCKKLDKYLDLVSKTFNVCTDMAKRANGTKDKICASAEMKDLSASQKEAQFHLCFLCGKKHLIEDDLKDHRQEEHKDQKCFDIARSKDEGDATESEHVGAVNNSEVIVALKQTGHACLICEKTFTSYLLWMKHVGCHVSSKDLCTSKVTNKAAHVPTKGKLSLCCPVCGRPYRDQASLSRHLRRAAFKCSLCEKHFIRYDTLKNHMTAKHQVRNLNELVNQLGTGKDTNSVLCAMCGAMNADITSNGHICKLCQLVRQEPGTGIGGNKYTCKVCGIKKNDKSNLKAHLQTHQRTKRFSCNQCSKSFYRERSLITHKLDHAGERPFCCETCGLRFTRKDKLRSHINYKHKKSYGASSRFSHTASTLCQICGLRVRGRNQLWNHLLIHEGPSDLNCPFCDQPFAYPGELSAHGSSLHMNTKTPFPCCLCQEKFEKKLGLLEHYKTHPDKAVHSCLTCKETFHIEADLREHVILKHAWKERRKKGVTTRQVSTESYICEICHKVYSTRAGFSYHMKAHYGLFDFSCDFCDKKFKSKSEKVVHLRTHTKEKPFKCQLCENSFRRVSDLNIHMRRHTGERPYLCDKCGAGFKTRLVFKKHKEMHVKYEKSGQKVKYRTQGAPRPFKKTHLQPQQQMG